MGVKSTKEVNESKEALEMGDDINEALAALEDMEGEFENLSSDLSIDDVESLSNDLDDMDLDEALKALEDPETSDVDDVTIGEPPMPADSKPIEEPKAEEKDKEKKTSKSSKKTSKKKETENADGGEGEKEVPKPVPAEPSASVDTDSIVKAVGEAVDKRVTKLMDDLQKSVEKELKALGSKVVAMEKEVHQFTEAWRVGAEVQRENTNGVINRLDNLSNSLATVMAQMDKLTAGGTKTKDGEEEPPEDEISIPKSHLDWLTNAMNLLVAKGMGARQAASAVRAKLKKDKGVDYTEDQIIKATKP